MKRVLYGLAFVVLLIAGVFLTGKRALFLWRAEKTSGAVASISSSNSTCGRKSSRRDCTQFHANVSFKAKDGSEYSIGVPAGSTDGHNASVNHASAKVGNSIEVLYDPSNPTEALDNSFVRLWSGPLISFVGAIFCVIPAFRRR